MDQSLAACNSTGASSLHSELDALGFDSAAAELASSTTDERLRALLRRCSSGAGAQLRIQVLGGSMTLGRMNSVGSGAVDRGDLSWSAHLRRELQARLPCPVVVDNLARGARPISWAAHTYAPPSGGALVLEDFSINDRANAGNQWGAKPNREYLHAAAEALMRAVLASEWSAFAHIDSWPSWPPRCPQELPPQRRERDGAELGFFVKLGAAYNTTVLSYANGVCGFKRSAAAAAAARVRLWPGGCGALDAEGDACDIHPGPRAHAVLGKRVAAWVLDAAAAACVAGEHGAGRRRPPPMLDASCPLVTAPEVYAKLRSCPKELSAFNAEEACGKPMRADGFTCYADRPGKRGWIGAGSSRRQATITFEMPLSTQGSLVAAYLRSYEGVGRALVWLDDDSDVAQPLDGLWASRTSQVDISALSMGALCGESCRQKHSAAMEALLAEHRDAAALVDETCRAVSLAPSAHRTHCHAAQTACEQRAACAPTADREQAADCCTRAQYFVGALGHWAALSSCARVAPALKKLTPRLHHLLVGGCRAGIARHLVHISTQSRFKLVRISSC